MAYQTEWKTGDGRQRTGVLDTKRYRCLCGRLGEMVRMSCNWFLVYCFNCKKVLKNIRLICK